MRVLHPKDVERIVRDLAKPLLEEGGNKIQEIRKKVSSVYPKLTVGQIDMIVNLIHVYIYIYKTNVGTHGVETVDEELMLKAILLLHAKNRGMMVRESLDSLRPFGLLSLQFLLAAKSEGMPDSFFDQVYDEDRSQKLVLAFTTWYTYHRVSGCTVWQADRYSWLSQLAHDDFSLEVPPFYLIRRFDDRSMVAILYFCKYFQNDVEMLHRVVDGFVGQHRSLGMAEFIKLLQSSSKMYDCIR